MKNTKSIYYTDRVYKILLIIFALFLLSFYKRMIENGDNPAHLKLAEAILNRNVNGGYMIHMLVYPLYHFSTRMVSFICLNDIYTAGMCILTMANVVAAMLMRRILNSICSTTNVILKYLCDFLSIFYLIFETFAGPLTDGRIYQRQCGPNPWHNPTITFVRPFGLIALVFFVKHMENVKNKKFEKRYLLLFSVMSLVSILAKPSFMMVFLPAMGLYVFLYWIKDLNGRFHVAMQLLLAVIPSIVIILFQFLFCQFYNSGSVSPVRIQLGGFSDFSTIEIIKVCIATFPVPIVALLLYREEILESAYSVIGYMALAVGVAEMFLLTNGETGDFSWGYDLAVGISTMSVLGVSLKINNGRWRRIPIYTIFACQVIVGFYYFIKVYNGGEYWF